MTRNSVLKPNFFQRIAFLNPTTFQITHNEKAEKINCTKQALTARRKANISS